MGLKPTFVPRDTRNVLSSVVPSRMIRRVRRDPIIIIRIDDWAIEIIYRDVCEIHPCRKAAYGWMRCVAGILSGGEEKGESRRKDHGCGCIKVD